MTFFSETTNRQLLKYIRKELYENVSQEQMMIGESFEFEKQWKNICFPILTPIYTKYKEDFK
jgi:hypothetical protein